MSGPFRRRTLLALVGITATSFVVGLGLMVFGAGLGDAPSHGSDTFSVSALGHSAWAELVRRAGNPVVVTRDARSRRVGSEGLLVIAEPNLDEQTLDAIASRLDASPAALLVLPKRYGFSDRSRPEWVRGVAFVAPEQVNGLLDRLGIAARVVRPELRTWGADKGLDVPDPQLLTRAGLETIVGNADGVLLGRVIGEQNELLVLSDPDVIANHGIHRADNAAIALECIRHSAAPGTVVVFDETVHGFAIERSLWRELFRFPLAYATLHAAFALALLLWAGMVRFGTPELVPPELGEGRRALIENTADLLAHGGHSGHSLRRALYRGIDDVLTRYGTVDLRRGERVDAAHAIAVQRGVRIDVRRIAEDVATVSIASRKTSARRIVAIARRLHAWRQETLDGNR